jgi:hypothetical protein
MNTETETETETTVTETTAPQEVPEVVANDDETVVEDDHDASDHAALRKEAASYRRRLRDTETSRDALAERVSVLQEMMGHRDFKTTLIYADYAPSAMESEWAEAAFGTPGTNPGTNLSEAEVT